MKFMTRIVLVSAMATLSASAFAANLEMNATAEIISGPTLTENKPINFGQFTKSGDISDATDKTFTLTGDDKLAVGAGSGTATKIDDSGEAGRLQLNGAGLANITWKADPTDSAQVVTMLKTGSSGTVNEEKFEISNFVAYDDGTVNPNSSITLVSGVDSFVSIGGDIKIKNGQTEGTYTGKVNVYVNY